MRKFNTAVIMIVLVSFTSAGCATLAHGTYTKVSVKTEPPGALATIDGKSISTPGQLLSKSNKPGTVVITKEGYKSLNVYLEQQMSGWVWGNCLIGGLIGVGIDYASGAAYKLSPKDINVTLDAAN